MNTLRPPLTVPCFVATYLVVWALAGGVLSLIVAMAPGVVAGGATVGIAGALAAAWQLSPVKRRCVRFCRGMRVPPAGGARAVRAAVVLGARHGAACVGSCAGLMLVMLVAPGPPLVWTAVLALVVWAEKARGLARPLARPTAALLATVAALALVLGGGGLLGGSVSSPGTPPGTEMPM
jgi:predicted metal-binding membrane protein